MCSQCPRITIRRLQRTPGRSYGVVLSRRSPTWNRMGQVSDSHAQRDRPWKRCLQPSASAYLPCKWEPELIYGIYELQTPLSAFVLFTCHTLARAHWAFASFLGDTPALILMLFIVFVPILFRHNTFI